MAQKVAALPPEDFERFRGGASLASVGCGPPPRPVESVVNDTLQRAIAHIKKAEDELILFENLEHILVQLANIRKCLANCALTVKPKLHVVGK